MRTYKDFGIDIPYNRTSGNVKVFCPQCRDRRHNKTDKSLSVDLDKGVWNCHYCGFAGGINERNYNADALKYQRKEYKKPESTGFPVFSEKVVAWFARRGISLPTLTKAGVTEGDEWMPQKEAKVPTIQFNYFKDGELVNIKFRTEDKCFKLIPGAELLPYNLDAIKGEKECVICEGEADALSFIEIGYNNVVSVPNGANTNLTYLDDYWDDYFEDKETVYIASDSDTKGVLLREELLRRFGPERCRIIEYGEGCKDANEHLVMYGKDSLIECVKNAPEPKIEGIFTTSDIEDSLDAIYESGLKKGYTIGVEGVDKLCSFETKRLCVLTGVPSCLDENTLVDMADGTRKPISQVEIGEKVVTLNDDYTLGVNAISNKWDSGIKECFEIETRDGHKVIASAQHRFLTFDGWKEVKDIKEGDFIGTPVGYNSEGQMNEDILKLMAIWMADGHKTSDSFTITNATPDVISTVRDICERNFLRLNEGRNFMYRICVNKSCASSYDRYIAEISHWYRQKGCGKNLAKLIAHEKWEHKLQTKPSLFIPNEELRLLGFQDMTTHTLRVPDKIMSLENAQIAIFLNHLFACDGSFYRGQIEYCSVSQRLCEDIQCLLSRFSISSTVRKKMVKYKNERRLAFVLNIDAYTDVAKFTREIGIIGKQKQMDEYINSHSPNEYKTDYIPSTIKSQLAHGTKFYKKNLELQMSMNDRRKVRVNRQMVIECAKLQDDGERIIQKLDRGCRWREIKSITPIGARHTYDIEVENTHNFIANGIVSHNSGKSTFLNYIAERLNLRYNWKFAFFSPESAPISYHGSTLIELLTGKKFSKQTLPYNEYLQAKQHLQKNFFFIYPKDDFRLDAILEKAKILVRKKGIKALVIDPFNRLENEQGSKVSETQYISQVLDRLTNFAQQNDVLIFLMAHPTKMPKNVEGEFEVPTLYNISGSANFYNKADFGITVHRNKSGGWTEIHIQKVKFRHLGEQGMVKLKYNLNNGRYCEYFEGVPPNYDNTNHLILKAVDDAKKAEKEAVFEFDTDFDNDLPF